MNFIRIQNTLINLSLVEELEAQSRCRSANSQDIAYYPAINVRFQGRQELFVLKSVYETALEAVQAAIDYLAEVFKSV